MKKILIAVEMIIITTAGAAEPAVATQLTVGSAKATADLKPGTPRKAKMTRDQHKALAYQTMMKRTGGFVVRPESQLGKVVSVNGQKARQFSGARWPKTQMPTSAEARTSIWRQDISMLLSEGFRH